VRTASKVFGAIGIFAVAAAVLFMISGGTETRTMQGALVLLLFGLANGYLWRTLGQHGRAETDGLVVPGAASLDEVQHNDPASLHLPGPSIFPAIYSVAAGLILVGLLTSYAVVIAGVVLFVVASVGWGVEAVKEYRYAQEHGGHDDHHGDVDPHAATIAHRISAFRTTHGGATASLQHVGRGSGRIVLVGADGEWGEVFVKDVAHSAEACSLAGVECSESWPTGLGARMRNTPEFWERMGAHAPAAPHGPRDGYLQVGARVFLAIAIFAFGAAALFITSGRGRASSGQGSLILAMFGIANVYLFIFMRNARGGADDHKYAAPSGIAAEPLEPEPAMDPDDIHLPGPSVWPAVFSVAAGAVLIGLISSTLVTFIGLGLFVLAAIGWTVQAVAEYRLALAGGHAGHGGGEHGDAAPQVDHITASGH
jgi:hypothetical protein